MAERRPDWPRAPSVKWRHRDRVIIVNSPPALHRRSVPSRLLHPVLCSCSKKTHRRDKAEWPSAQTADRSSRGEKVTHKRPQMMTPRPFGQIKRVAVAAGARLFVLITGIFLQPATAQGCCMNNNNKLGARVEHFPEQNNSNSVFLFLHSPHFNWFTHKIGVFFWFDSSVVKTPMAPKWQIVPRENAPNLSFRNKCAHWHLPQWINRPRSCILFDSITVNWLYFVLSVAGNRPKRLYFCGDWHST